MTERNERRLKIARIDQQLFLEMLNCIARREVVELPVIPEIPDGTEVVRVYEDLHRQEWALVLRSQTFNEVATGGKIPVIPELLEWRAFRRRSLFDTHSSD